ncbi:uncharacterized protein [Antedon mediterranea]|uniref:uncharacterized protein isoform X2 n=1 Tax=Antedon mediterranea TaxID=105859 RepID=UPI003AF8F3C1
MARFKAKFDYVKERDDVLSFKKGDLFEITNKVDERWWAARAESDNSIGYVPALYLEPVKDKPIGRLVPEGRKDTVEHDYHLEALAELQSKVRPLPAHVLGQALGISVPSEDQPPILPYKHPLKKSTRLVQNDNETRKSKSTHRAKTPPAVAEKKTRGQSVKEQRCYDNIPEADYDDDTPIGNEETDSDVPVMAVRPTVQKGKHVRSSTYNGTSSFTEQKRNGVESPAAKNVPKQNNAKHSRHKTVDVAYDHNANPKSPIAKTPDKLPYHHQFPPPQEPPPPPDYDLNGEDELNEDGVPYHHQLNKSGRDSSSDEGQPTSPVQRAFLPADDNPVLIPPKPLPNPVKGSRMHKDLHFELKHSGRDVLKPELTRIMTQRKHQKSKAELEEEKKNKRTSLEIKLQERQDRIKQEDEKKKVSGESIPEEPGQAELYRIRKSLRSNEATKT